MPQSWLWGSLGMGLAFCHLISSGAVYAQSEPNPITPDPPPSLPDTFTPPFVIPNVLTPARSQPATSPLESANNRACVQGVKVVGSTVFSADELAAVVQPLVRSPDAIPCQNSLAASGFLVTFEQLIQARTAVTDFYVEQGYVTSGAFIPEQAIADGQISIQVIEGRLETIEIMGLQRLQQRYVRDRLRLAGATPLNTSKLLAGLQLLQQDPRIATINAELAAGIEPSSSLLKVQVQEADPWEVNLGLNNARSANVGTVRRQVQVSHNNVLGWGDRLSLDFTNTNGSGTVDASYTVPLNARNGSLTVSYTDSDSRVVQAPFDVLNIESDSSTYGVSWRQPIHQTPTEEWVLGLSLGRHEGGVTLNPLNTGEVPFPTRGSDPTGKTNISTVRFTQDWLRRSEQEVVAVRSQFNVGLNLFETTQNASAPDGQFVSWQGQGQWVRRLGRDTLLVVRGNVQWSDRALPSVEQLSLGGAQTVRGYPQSLLTTDGGAFASLEVRWPLFRVPEVGGVLQVAPFVDAGLGWNVDGVTPSPQGIAGAGLGLIWQDAGGWSARLDWGIPLVDFVSSGNSAQENGLHFSINWSPF